MKMGKYAVTAAVMLLLMTGCAKQPVQETKTSSAQEETAVSETVAAEAETEAYNNEKQLAAYRAVLENIYYDQTFPDGQDYSMGEIEMEDNRFAVCDIDQDGRDELIVEFTTTSMAGMVEFIYDYDDVLGTVYEELKQFPNLTFYDNGVITAGISHNQGYAGEFWPFDFYKYDSESDTYVHEGYADAWDRTLAEVDYDGNAFSAEADEDADGIVYYVMYGDELDYDAPMDLDAYETWYENYVGNVREIQFLNLTEENIAGVQKAD